MHIFNTSFLARSTPRVWPSIPLPSAFISHIPSKSLLSQHGNSEEGGLHKSVDSDMTVSYLNPQASGLKDC